MRTTRPLLATALATAALTLPARPAAAAPPLGPNLLGNGSFESPTFPPSVYPLPLGGQPSRRMAGDGGGRFPSPSGRQQSAGPR